MVHSFNLSQLLLHHFYKKFITVYFISASSLCANKTFLFYDVINTTIWCCCFYCKVNYFVKIFENLKILCLTSYLPFLALITLFHRFRISSAIIFLLFKNFLFIWNMLCKLKSLHKCQLIYSPTTMLNNYQYQNESCCSFSATLMIWLLFKKTQHIIQSATVKILSSLIFKDS